jgi:hypothetical protein
MNTRLAALEALCQRFGVDTLYLFGSRAEEVRGWFSGGAAALEASSADVDVGVKPLPGVSFTLDDKVTLAGD